MKKDICELAYCVERIHPNCKAEWDKFNTEVVPIMKENGFTLNFLPHNFKRQYIRDKKRFLELITDKSVDKTKYNYIV